MCKRIMDGTSKTKKQRIQQLQKTLLTLLILFLFYGAFKDSLPDIWQQLKAASITILVQTLLASVFYHCMEGLITTMLVRKHLPEFSLQTGIQCAFYCSFFRVATFGNGAGAAGVYFLHQNGIDAAKAAGIYMVQYIFHKISITLFALFMLLCNFTFMYNTYFQYGSYLAAGIGVTLLIVIFLLILCLSDTCHKLIYRICLWLSERIEIINPDDIREKLILLKNSSAQLVENKRLLFLLIIINFIKLGFWFCIPYLILHNEASLTLASSLSITSLMTALAGMIPTPAGIGSIEFVYMLLFVPVTGTVSAASSMLLYRFATYFFPILPGGLIILIRKINIKKKKNMLT